jgi:hypothetical protein
MNARDRYLCFKAGIDRQVDTGYSHKMRNRTSVELERYLKMRKRKLRVVRIRKFANALERKVSVVDADGLLVSANDAMCYGLAKSDASFVLWERKVGRMSEKQCAALMLGELI